MMKLSSRALQETLLRRAAFLKSLKSHSLAIGRMHCHKIELCVRLFRTTTRSGMFKYGKGFFFPRHVQAFSFHDTFTHNTDYEETSASTDPDTSW